MLDLISCWTALLAHHFLTDWLRKHCMQMPAAFPHLPESRTQWCCLFILQDFVNKCLLGPNWGGKHCKRLKKEIRIWSPGMSSSNIWFLENYLNCPKAVKKAFPLSSELLLTISMVADNIRGCSILVDIFALTDRSLQNFKNKFADF